MEGHSVIFSGGMICTFINTNPVGLSSLLCVGEVLVYRNVLMNVLGQVHLTLSSEADTNNVDPSLCHCWPLPWKALAVLHCLNHRVRTVPHTEVPMLLETM